MGTGETRDTTKRGPKYVAPLVAERGQGHVTLTGLRSMGVDALHTIITFIFRHNFRDSPSDLI